MSGIYTLLRACRWIPDNGYAIPGMTSVPCGSASYFFFSKASIGRPRSFRTQYSIKL